MKYPLLLQIIPTAGGGFDIEVYEDFTPDIYEAKNAEELLEFLKGVYEDSANLS